MYGIRESEQQSFSDSTDVNCINTILRNPIVSVSFREIYVRVVVQLTLQKNQRTHCENEYIHFTKYSLTLWNLVGPKPRIYDRGQ